ncbi:MAG: hypothetical protein ACJ72W_20185 [Actinoallomurus sp.]
MIVHDRYRNYDSSELGAHNNIRCAASTDRAESQWRGGLPKPVLQGHRATYQDAIDGSADLVVEATRTGFEQFVAIAVDRCQRGV